MEQKIDLEIRLRELAAQSMLEVQNEIDILEVEKSLLTSDQRMNCYAMELEQQRKQLSNPSLSTDSGRGSRSRTSDVIGGHGTATGSSTDRSSPSFSSLSNSQSSPSKLSPVSGQSASSAADSPNGAEPLVLERNSNTSGSDNDRNNNTVAQAGASGSPTKTTAKMTGGSNSRAIAARTRTTTTISRHSAGNTLQSGKLRNRNKRRELLLQSISNLSNINCNMVLDNRACVQVSEIRIPLMWRDVDHFKGRGDYKLYAVFCLLKINSQIYDTQLISDVDRKVTDITFDDVVVFNEIDHDFELYLEVYSCVYLEQFSLSSTPRKLKEKLTSSVSKAMGRRLMTQTASANYTKELQAYDKSYRFSMIASARLRLEDAADSVKTYDLALASGPSSGSGQSVGGHSAATMSSSSNNNNSSSKDVNKNTLPLFGNFCCKLYVKPEVFDKNIKSGYLKVARISLPSGEPEGLASSARKAPAAPETAASSGRGSGSPASFSNGSSSSNDAEAKSSAPAAGAGAIAPVEPTSSPSAKMATLSMSSARIYWALLRNFILYLWPVDEEQAELALIRCEPPPVDLQRKPSMALSIDKFTRLLRVSNSSLTLETESKCLIMGAYCINAPAAIGKRHGKAGPAPEEQHQRHADEMSQWLRAIEQQIYDSHIWGSALNHYSRQTNSAMDRSKSVASRSHGRR